MDTVNEFYTVVCGCGCGACADIAVSEGGLFIRIEGGDAPELASLETLQNVANDLADGVLRAENDGGLATVEIDAADKERLHDWLRARGLVLPGATGE